jgi:hypothetical protein
VGNTKADSAGTGEDDLTGRRAAVLKFSAMEHARLVELAYGAGLRPTDYCRHLIGAAAGLIPAVPPRSPDGAAP